MAWAGLSALAMQAQLVAPQLRAIGTSEGLSHPYVWDLALDQRGYLWVATSDGLNRFDGRQVEVFRAQRRPGTLPADFITALAADGDRWLYVGTSAPFLTIVDVFEDTLTNIPLPIPDFSRHGEQRITSIHIDRQQRVWLGHGARCLSLFDPGTRTFITTEVPPPLPTPRVRELISKIDEDRDGTLWLSMFQGLVRFDPRTMQQRAVPLHPAPGEPVQAAKFHIRGMVDEDTTMVFGTWGEGIFRMRKSDGQLRLLWPHRGHVPTYVDHIVTDLVPVGNGKALVASMDQGLLQLDLRSGQVDHFDRSLNEADCRKRQDLFPGCYRLLKAGDLLVMGSTTQGAALWDTRSTGVTAIPLPMHDPAETIDAVQQVRIDPATGDVLALSSRRGLFLFDSLGQLRVHIGMPYDPAQRLRDMQQLGPARWAIGGVPKPLSAMLSRDRVLQPLGPPMDRCAKDVRWMRPDGRHGLWLMTRTGLFHQDTIAATCRPIADEYPDVAEALSTDPWDIFLDSRGRSWFLSANRPPVVLHPDGRTEVIEGPPTLAPFEVSDIAETPDGRIWLVAKLTGLALVEGDGPIRPRDVGAELASRNLLEVLAMEDNTLWFTLPGGLLHWDPASGSSTLLGPQRGIAAGPLNLDASHRPVPYPVLAGTWEGFYRVGRASLATHEPPHVEIPQVLSEDSIVLRHADLATAALVLPPATDRVGILLRTTELADPLRGEFAYRLVGHADGWAVIGGSERITFNGLRHGRYHFEVKARDKGGEWGRVSMFSLVIRPPWWATWWFRLLAVLAAALATWAVFRMVLRRKLREQRRRMEHEKALLQERIRIAHDLHDDLGSGLATIGMESAMAGMEAQDPELRSALLRVSESARNVSNDMRRIIWAMGSGQETLGDLLAYVRGFAAEMLDQAGVSLRFVHHEADAGRVLTVQQRRHLLLFTKEALHNVIKHAQARTVTVEVDGGDRLRWQIHDDGRGYDVAERDGAGTGTTSMRERARQLGGELSVESAPAQGTTIRLSIPW